VQGEARDLRVRGGGDLLAERGEELGGPVRFAAGGVAG